MDLQRRLENYISSPVKNKEHTCTVRMEYSLSMIKLVSSMRFIGNNQFDISHLEDLWKKLNNIKDIGEEDSKFPIDQQGDAAELLVFTIDYFNVLFKILEKESYLDKIPYVFTNTYGRHELCEMGWSKAQGDHTFTYNSPYITNCFGLTTLRTNRQGEKCSCGHMRAVQEQIDLSTNIVLSFPPTKRGMKNPIDIQTLFNHYFKENKDMKLNCSNDNCKEQVCIVETCELYNFPKVLLIYLNRFCVGKEGTMTKNGRKVKIPLRELDISKHVLNHEDDQNMFKNKYDLFHVILHGGTYNSGHYTNCHLYNGNVWHIIDDDEIMPVTDKEIMDKLRSNEPYVLLYKLRDEFVRRTNHTL